MRKLTLLLAACVIAAVALQGQTAPFYGTAAIAPSLPNVIPIALDAFSPAPNPDGTPCTFLYQNIRENAVIAATPSPWPCPTSVVVQHYGEFIQLKCSTLQQQVAFAYANGTPDETAFAHAYPNALSAATRYAKKGPVGTPGCHPTPSPDPTFTPNYFMNLGSPSYQSFLVNNVWASNSDQNNNPGPPSIPIKMGLWEDTVLFECDAVVGGSPTWTEYGGGSSPNIPCTANGTSASNVGFSWTVAEARFANAAWQDGLTVTFNGAGSATNDIDPCSNIAGGHCNASTFPLFIDDEIALGPFCSNLNQRNVPYIFLEHPFLHEGSPPTTPGVFGNTQTLVAEINTWIELVTLHQTDNCSNLKFVLGEFLVDPSPNTDNGKQIRLEQMAARWLVPNPQNGIPDRIIQGDQPIGGLDAANEVPITYDNTITPSSPETVLTNLVWNGTTQSVGDNCGGATTDSGGATLLKVACNADNSSILMMKYRHCQINKVDKGPCAAILNTSTSVTANVVAAWFTAQGGDAIGTYKFQYVPTITELSQLPFTGVNDPGCGTNCIAIPGCSSANCAVAPAFSSQVATFHGDGTDTIAPQTGMILFKAGS